MSNNNFKLDNMLGIDLYINSLYNLSFLILIEGVYILSLGSYSSISFILSFYNYKAYLMT